MAGDLVGAETNVEFVDNLLMHIEWTGTTPVGVFSVEFLKTSTGNTLTDVWEAINFGATIAITGNSGSHTIQFNELPFTKIRPKYTRTSGTGAMTVTLIGKGV